MPEAITPEALDQLLEEERDRRADLIEELRKANEAAREIGMQVNRSEQRVENLRRARTELFGAKS